LNVNKYRGGVKSIFDRDLNSLEQDWFWAPTREKLNDPCEGMVSPETLLTQLELIVKIFGAADLKVQSSFEKLKMALNDMLNHKDTSGVYSLSQNPTDELLWAHYAYSHYGFCIEYDLETLLRFGRNDFKYFNVVYDEHPPQLTIDDLSNLQEGSAFIQKLIGVKSKKWVYEQEIRIVTSKSGKQHYDYRSIKAIHFGLRMEDGQKEEIMRRMQGRGIKYYQTQLESNSYKLVSVPVEDLYQTDEKYLYSIAPIAKLAVDPKSLNAKWKKFASYLPKVAEIVRRDPYCHEVLLVDISESKSEPNNPIFFGQFEREKNRFENQYFTTEEIDKKYSQIKDIAESLRGV
jgi:Protein of unknown function (DUF2971)